MTAPTVEDLDGLEDELAFWHPTDDAEASEALLAWGTVARSSSDDLRLRVRNLSGVYWARDVIIAVAEPGAQTLTRPVADQHLLSVDGHTFAATAAIGDLAPQAISGQLVLRRVVAADADEGPAGFLLTADAGAWATAGDTE